MNGHTDTTVMRNHQTATDSCALGCGLSFSVHVPIKSHHTQELQGLALARANDELHKLMVDHYKRSIDHAEW